MKEEIDKVLAGIMRFKDTPPMRLLSLLTMICEYNGIELIYLSPKSVNIEKGTVEGKMLVNGELITATRELPKIIDISPHYYSSINKRKYKELLNYLSRTTELSIDRRNIIGKEKLQTLLLNTEELSEIAIPFEPVENLDGFSNFIKKHNEIVVKPLKSLQGKGVVSIKKVVEGYIFSEQKESKIMNQLEIEQYFEEHFFKRRYTMQKYINSRSKDGDPIDCQIIIEKNGKGKWEIAGQFVRIGLGQTIVSNIQQGGCISNLKGYLKSNFTENWKDIYENITNVGRTLPYLLEEHTGTKYMSMGLDIGIDTKGNLCLFEVNSYPALGYLKGRVAKLRGEYFAYRIKRQLYEKEFKKRYRKNKEKFENKEKKLNNENLKLRKEINLIKQSNSWKITKPIRAIGKVFKK